MVSTLFVAGSIATYDSFSSFETGLQFRADFAAVSGLVTQAIERGNSSATMTLLTSTFSCHRGSLTLSSGSSTEGLVVPVGCDFLVTTKEGAHVVGFTLQSSQLILTVT